MSHKRTFLSLDVGEKRIGVALGDDAVRIAVPYDTIEVDGTEIAQISRIITGNDVSTVVVGYPRNQSGEPTAQTAYAEDFAKKLTDIAEKIEFQDESVTSVLAEQQLKSLGKPYSKGDIDARAASIILQDYLERL